MTHQTFVVQLFCTKCCTLHNHPNAVATKRAVIGRDVLQQGKLRQASINSCTFNFVYSILNESSN